MKHNKKCLSLFTHVCSFSVKCQSSWGISSAIHTIIVNQISSSWQFPKCVQLPTVWPLLVSLLAEVVGLPASFFQKLITFIVKRQVYENVKTKGTMNSKAAAHAVWLHYFPASHDVFTAASYLKDSESWLIVPKLLHSFIWLTTYIFANTSGYLFKVSALLAVLQKQILRIGIRFGSQGFGSKLIGDPKISFDIKKKEQTLQSKTKGCTFIEKSFLAAKLVYFSYVFVLSLNPLKKDLEVILFKDT